MNERTEGIVRQAQELIEQAYQRGYKAGYDTGVTDGYKKGFEEGYSNAETDYHAQTENDRQSSYELGLNMAWEAARKLVFMDYRECNKVLGYNLDSVNEIFVRFNASEAIEKIRKHEEQKKQEEINVGDEVVYYNDSKVRFIVTKVKNGCISGFNTTGEFSNKNASCWVKTGRHFSEIVEVLKKMQEGE